MGDDLVCHGKKIYALRSNKTGKSVFTPLAKTPLGTETDAVGSGSTPVIECVAQQTEIERWPRIIGRVCTTATRGERENV